MGSVCIAEPQVAVGSTKLFSAATERQRCVLSGLLSHRLLSAQLNFLVLRRKGNGGFPVHISSCCQQYKRFLRLNERFPSFCPMLIWCIYSRHIFREIQSEHQISRISFQRVPSCYMRVDGGMGGQTYIHSWLTRTRLNSVRYQLCENLAVQPHWTVTSRPTTFVRVRSRFGGRFTYPLVSGYLTILIICTDLKSIRVWRSRRLHGQK
jgi:hypothetical protein